MTELETDVLIIGARVAGATLAAQLGDAGHNVLLVDRAGFPSPTLSTHFFRGAQAVRVFKYLKVLDDLLAAGSPPLTRQYVYADGRVAPDVQDPQDPGEIGYCLSVRRVTLDDVLVRRASKSPPVTVLEKTRVTGLTFEHGRVTGATVKGDADEVLVRARLVVAADGRHSLVAREIQASAEEEAPPYRAMFYCYQRDFSGPNGGSADGPEFSRCGDEVAYVFPSDHGIACVALTINVKEYARARPNRMAFFQERIAAHRGIAERFKSATWVSKLMGSVSDPNYVRVPYGPGWTLLGDAGMHQDPWSGQGIDMATVHSTFLAEAIDSCLKGEAPENEALRIYHQRRNEHGLDVYRRTVELSKDLSEPR